MDTEASWYHVKTVAEVCHPFGFPMMAETNATSLKETQEGGIHGINYIWTPGMADRIEDTVDESLQTTSDLL